MFDAGALIFRIQTVGAQLFQQDQRDAKDAFDKTGKAAADAGKQVDQSGAATEKTSKKARESKKPLEDQAKATEQVGKQSQQSSQQQEKQADSTERQIETAKKLSAGLLVAGLAVTALVGLSVAKYAEFDQAMSQTSAATMATAAEQKALGEAALEAGADTAYSASEAAAAEEELAKAGQSVSDIVGGSLNASLGLAAAGQLAVARSAEIMATTLTQFRLPAEQAAHVADVLAAGAGKAQGSVDDLSLALSYVGPLAGSVGLSLDETAGTIAYFATQGIIGEKAGTALRGVLAGLQAPSAAADRELKKYNISVFDANGNMLSLAGIADQLRSNLGDLTEQERLAALGRIFGNESLNAATLLYEGGAQAIDEWTANVTDAGYAAEQAAMRQDNLAGDIEKLGGAFDTALIRTGSGANDVLRLLVQNMTGLVDIFGEAPAPVHAITLGLGVGVAAMLLFAGGAVGVRAKLIELKATLDTTGASFSRTALLGAGAGLALTGVLAVVGLLAARQAELNAITSDFADTLDEQTGAITDNTRARVAQRLAESGAFEAAREAGIGQKELTDAIIEGGDALDAVKKKLTDNNTVATFFTGVGIRAGVASQTIRDLATGIEQAKIQHNDLEAATDDSTAATDANASATQSAAQAYIDAAGGASDLESDLRDLLDTINEANGVNQDAIGSNAKYQAALHGIGEEVARQRDEYERTNGTLEGFTLSLDRNTFAGSQNAASLTEVAGAAQDAALKQLEADKQTMSSKDATDKYNATLAAQKQAFIDSALQAGYNADEVHALADEVFNLPSAKQIQVSVETAAAEDRLRRFQDQQRLIRVGVEVFGQQSYQIAGTNVRFNADGAVYPGARYFAGGGTVSEHHVAQMARAGDVRVWAEPETGGESYVPHSPAKRARSEQIMTETAGILGGRYIPAGAVPYADGSAPVVPASVSASPSVAVFNIYDADRKLIGTMRGEAVAAVEAASRVTAVGLSSGESSR